MTVPASTTEIATPKTRPPSTIGPNLANNVSPGWNSEVFTTSATGTTYFEIEYCRSSKTSLIYELMHHWPFLPSTGKGQQTYACNNTSTWVAKHWSVSGGSQYSMEYSNFVNGTTTATYTYWISYP